VNGPPDTEYVYSEYTKGITFGMSFGFEM
jgi:hypothetical protein